MNHLFSDSHTHYKLLWWKRCNLPDPDICVILSRAALTTHTLEWLEPWRKLAELEQKTLNRELVYVGTTKVTQST